MRITALKSIICGWKSITINKRRRRKKLKNKRREKRKASENERSIVCSTFS
jgi:hypothetical protein